jgi:hypothetical protein
MLFLQLFVAPGTEAKAPARFLGKEEKKEAHFSQTTVPLAGDVYYGTDRHTANQWRRYGHTGSLTAVPFMGYRTTGVSLPGIVQGKESFCIPIALRLLFPGHYFW